MHVTGERPGAIARRGRKRTPRGREQLQRRRSEAKALGTCLLFEPKSENTAAALIVTDDAHQNKGLEHNYRKHKHKSTLREECARASKREKHARD